MVLELQSFQMHSILLHINRPRCKTYQHDYQLKGETLVTSTHTPYVGVTIRDNLEWENHINRIMVKVSSTLGFSRRNLKCPPSKLKETAYISMVRSTLKYSCAIWDPFQKKDIDKKNQIHRSATRFVTSSYSRKASVSIMLKSLGWEDL